MRALAEAWAEEPIVQQLIARLREWYLRAALEHCWSQNVLVHMISGQLHDREGKALTNFKRNLPPPDSDRLLHNWFLNSHPPFGTFSTQGTKPTGVLL